MRDIDIQAIFELTILPIFRTLLHPWLSAVHIDGLTVIHWTTDKTLLYISEEKQKDEPCFAQHIYSVVYIVKVVSSQCQLDRNRFT